MPSNLDLLNPLLARVTRTLDLGGFADAYAGQCLTVWVNPPAILDELLVDDDPGHGYDARRKIVAILFDLPFEEVKKMDDALMVWLYVQGLELRRAYHETLKNSKGGSVPTSIP